MCGTVRVHVCASGIFEDVGILPVLEEGLHALHLLQEKKRGEERRGEEWSEEERRVKRRGRDRFVEIYWVEQDSLIMDKMDLKVIPKRYNIPTYMYTDRFPGCNYN